MIGPRILAIESSCDETGVAVVVGGRRIESNQVASQVAVHAATGGIVPEVAARQQLRWIVPTLEAALAEADGGWEAIDAIAVTYGPGLIGSLLVGVNVAKALAATHDLPLIGVNHIEGHIYANWLTDGDREAPLPAEPPFPLLCLVVSGGHTQLVLMEATGATGCWPDGRRRRGRGLRQGWAAVGAAVPGRPGHHRRRRGSFPATRFPRARTDGRYDFSFSGLKTAVLREVEGYRERGEPIPDRRPGGLLRGGGGRRPGGQDRDGRARSSRSPRSRLAVAWPPTRACARSCAGGWRPLVCHCWCRLPAWCTDNGAMIGAAGGFRFLAGDRAGPTLEAIPNLALPWLDR